MAENNAVVGIYNSHTEAEASIKELQRSGFDMKKLSIVGKDYHTEEHVVGYYNAGDRMKFWGKLGAFWGGFWGLLFGSAFFMIPGIGPLVVFGPLVGWIAGVLEGAVVVGGLSALGAGLYSIGIPKDSVMQYETALKSDKFVVTGKLLGQVEDIVIDARSGCVRYAVLALGGFLGIGRKRLAVPWSVLTPDANHRRCIVDVTLMRLIALPVPHANPSPRQADLSRCKKNAYLSRLQGFLGVTRDKRTG